MIKKFRSLVSVFRNFIRSKNVPDTQGFNQYKVGKPIIVRDLKNECVRVGFIKTINVDKTLNVELPSLGDVFKVQYDGSNWVIISG